MSKQNPVAVPSHEYKEMAPIWRMVDTLWAGTRAMRSAGKTYLPQMPDEPDKAYINRLGQSVLTNYYRDTIEKLVAKPLKQPIVFKDDVPTSIQKYADNIDGQGTDVDTFTKQVGEAALHHGITFVLVDFPPTPEGSTKLEETMLGVRPYAVHYRAPQIIGWKSAVINGHRQVTQIRILEETYEDSGEFSQTEVKRIRVLEPGYYRVYEWREVEQGKEDWVLSDEYPVKIRGELMTFIPIIPVYAGQTGFLEAEPKLLDLADLNIAHWQSDSDQRNILHVARVPILFAAGLGDEGDENPISKLNIGATTYIKGQLGSSLSYVEHSGKGIEAGRQDLQDLESRMAQMGLNMIIKGRSGTATATARVLDQSEADSPLAMFARELERVLMLMLDYFGVFLGMGDDQGGTVELFKEFSITMRDAEDIKELGNMRARGDISQKTYWFELQRRGLLSDDFDATTEIDYLDLEDPGRLGLTEWELEQGNMPGDETGEADGHTHVLQANGWTNTVNGHRHKWEPTDSFTGAGGPDGHKHPLDAAVRDPAAQPQPTPSAPPSGQAPTEPKGSTSATSTGGTL